jgi:DNA modification methylase
MYGMKITEIKTNPDNPRLIKDDKFYKLVNSIREFPKMMELRPIVVDSEMMVLGGNMRLKALQELKIKDIPDNWVKKADELTDEEKKRFIISDNVGFGEWDWDVLANEWDSDQLEEWGLDLPDFDEKKIEVEEDNFEEDENIETDIQYGDMFQIGNHFLLCGDATKKEDCEKLLQGNKADLIFTDPPYELESVDTYLSINEISKNTNVLIWASDKQIPIIFDAKIGEFKRLYTIDTGIASPTNNDVYVNHIAILRFKVGDPTKFQNIHNSGRSIIKTDYRKNLKDENFGHKHQKSLKTLSLFIEYWSKEKENVIDIFGGSGSTMAASEQLKRNCYMMELEPKNCQIILDRMKKCYNLDANKLN